jgi:hypothetical protein
MEGIPSELAIVGGVGLALLAALILVKWGKQILTFLLVIAGVVVIVALIGWALLQRPDVIPDDAAETISDVADIARVLKPEPKSEPVPRPTYTAPAPSGGGFCAGVFAALLIVALGVGGYFYTRWKLSERGLIRREPASQKRQRPARRPTQQQSPPWAQWEWPDAPPVVYIDGYDDDQGGGIPDPDVWGW